jgi:hypothetical protein
VNWLAIFGWVCLVLIGGNFAVSGFLMSVISNGFCGRPDRIAIGACFCGIVLIAIAVYTSPFRITLAH